jgi:hypothetical protein
MLPAEASVRSPILQRVAWPDKVSSGAVYMHGAAKVLWQLLQCLHQHLTYLKQRKAMAWKISQPSVGCTTSC